MSLLAALRPDAVNLPLFVHVLGAMVMVGAAATVVRMAFVSEPTEAAAVMRRLVTRSLLLVALPAWLVMRVGAEWVRIEELGEAGGDLFWLELGYITAEGGGFFLLAGIVLAWRGSRSGRPRLDKAAAILVGIAVIVWVITAWAMAAKPA
jgi:hypothetical protein